MEFDLRRVQYLLDEALKWREERAKAIQMRPDEGNDTEYWQARHLEQIALEKQRHYEAMIGDIIVTFVEIQTDEIEKPITG